MLPPEWPDPQSKTAGLELEYYPIEGSFPRDGNKAILAYGNKIIQGSDPRPAGGFVFPQGTPFMGKRCATAWADPGRRPRAM